MRTKEEIEAAIKEQKHWRDLAPYEQKFSFRDIRDAKIQALEWVLEKLKDLI